MNRATKKRIVIFASGSGTNAERIIEYFQKKGDVEVALVLSNRQNAGVLQRAEKLNVPAQFFTKEELYSSGKIRGLLLSQNPDLIVLAGFLLKFPENILKDFENRVINIHPALLPKYGGKGMYGKFVHRAVVENNEAETGITVHYVNENYDEGAIISQKKVTLTNNETAESVAEKIQKLEHEWFPKIIEEILQNG